MKKTVFKKIIFLFSFILIFSSFLSFEFNSPYVYAKTKTVTFPESTSQSQTHTYTIPNLKSVSNVTVDNGSVSHSVSGDTITFNFWGGTSHRSVHTGTSSYQESKSVSGYLGHTYSGWYVRDRGDGYCEMYNYDAPNTVEYSDADGYSGTISYQYDGMNWSYTGYCLNASDNTIQSYDANIYTYYKGTVYKTTTYNTYDYYYDYQVTFNYEDNTSPTNPGSFATPSGSENLKNNDTLNVNWGASTDADGNTLTYQLDFYNGSTWSNLTTSTSSTSYSHTLPNINTTNAKYRVKANDGIEDSGWTESSTFTIDSTLPNGSFNPNSSSWSNSDISVTFNPSDTGGSGVNKWRYRLSSNNGSSYGNWSTYINGDTSDTISLTSNGTWKIQVEVLDNSGNLRTLTTGSYYFDETLPNGSFSPNSTSWTNSNIAVSFNPSDTGGSGVKNWRYRLSSNNGSTYGNWSSYITGDTTQSINLTSNGSWKVQVQVLDNANNLRTLTSGTHYLDKTLPNGSFNPNSTTWTNTDTTITFNPSDTGGSGVDKWRYRTSSNNGSTYGTWSNHIIGDTSDTINLTTNGSWKIEVEVLDNAGNTSTLVSGTQQIDETLPSGTFSPFNTNWTNNNVSVYFNPSDTGGSGVQKWRYRLSSNDGGSYGNWNSYIIGDTSDVISLTSNGSWKIEVEVLDNAGNLKTLVSGTHYIDKTNPGGTFSTPSGDWSNSDITVTFNPSDSGGSGVKNWRYRLSSNNGSSYGNWSTYINGDTTDAISLTSDGSWKIEAEVTDVAGNVVIITSSTFELDESLPDGIFTPYETDWTNTDITVSFNPSDTGGSGVDKWRYRLSSNDGGSYGTWSSYIVGDSTRSINFTTNGIWKIEVEVLDNAGNQKTLFSGSHHLEKTLPSGTFTPYETDWTTSDITLTFDPSDTGGSGVDKWRYRLTGNNGASYDPWTDYIIGDTSETVSFTGSGIWKMEVEVLDNAGNLTILESGAHKIDKQNPDGLFTPNGSGGLINSSLTVVFDPSDVNGSGVDKWRYRISHDNGVTYNTWSNFINGDTNGEITITGTSDMRIQSEVYDNVGNSTIVTSGIYQILASSKYFESTISGGSGEYVYKWYAPDASSESGDQYNFGPISYSTLGTKTVVFEVCDKHNPYNCATREHTFNVYQPFDSTEFTFDTNNQPYTWTAPYTGSFKLETWGAQGGGDGGGKGGYTTGVIQLNEGDVLHIYVGGSPGGTGTNWQTTGGYNGGGSCEGICFGGGGATDIRLNGTTLDHRIIVAGGGGGQGEVQNGGHGGGTTADNGSGNSVGTGGTQTEAGCTINTNNRCGSYGQGGTGQVDAGGGGGGYWGGGGASHSSDDPGGGGGSSYLSAEFTARVLDKGIHLGHGKAKISSTTN